MCYCFTPLSLLACISPKASPEFGDAFSHPPHMAPRTLDDIEQACIKADLNDFEEFVKAAKHYSLNDWPLSDPSKFLMPKVLHHFHHLFWDHDLQWCNNILRLAEIDYRFSLIQTPVGYHTFGEGVSKLKQRYIIGVIFLASISALLTFCYLAQMPSRVKATAIISSGGRQGSNGPLQHWEIPKLELLQHIVPSICNSGAIMQWTADVMEHEHVTEIKQPAHAGNNQDYYAQIAWQLDCSEKCL
ncbi:hypothetical protein BKA83DRAFT_4464917 [Pisolithus microcarpus]|nr:hypothetical protein BKA83DRAFT_4464917 [Pisolithus microcarpus]